MAGTVTVTETVHGSVKKIAWAWVATAGGAADKATAHVFDGKIVGFTTIPGAAGDAPTDNYDVTVTDAEGHDVLLGGGADRDTLNTERVADANLGAVAGSVLTLNVTNAGSAKKGTVILWVR